ncbi:MAG: class I SAM-dependent methyltransferase [Pyrinomonadaceae bacterium]|nr:class I SAM-dependent methyltransferase [Pyrinomonadaceae bacterium]MCX7640413.1 class I SAM-dependent methyltransferase [Pyrinomonadaceae bacterium]MDW8304840.1 class I SAM-dependent methyltransferase [Acidobacteriota bacterium]
MKFTLESEKSSASDGCSGDLIMQQAEMKAECLIACDLCNSTDSEEISLIDRDGDYLRTVICRQCGLVYSDPRPSSEQIRNYYRSGYRVDYKATFQPKPKHVYRAGKTALERFRRIERILKRSCRVLDFGAGSGELVFVLLAMGYEASGFEPNEGYARFASEVLGLPVAEGFYQDVQIEPESQDVVTAFHVIEHLESPYDAFKRVRDWLRPNGHLLVEVPNVEAVCQWPHSRFHRAHLYNFNLATLQMLGRKAGYSVVNSWISSDGGNIMVIFQKNNELAPVSVKIPGNYERVSCIIRNHTYLRHLFTYFPYVRPFQKIAARIEEQRAVRKLESPREILDALVMRELLRKRSSV